MSAFDPNGPAPLDAGVFGLPYSYKEAKLVYLPVPWEATTSYGGGTSKGPAAILEASSQVDLFDLEVSRPYEAGLHWLKPSAKIKAWNTTAKSAAQKIIRAGGVVGKNKTLLKALETVNSLSERMNGEVKKAAASVMADGKILGLVGGDHSTPFGALKAMAEREKDFGILHLDAHSDTRLHYEGFTWSHASIMRNVLDQLPEVKKIVQVGIRDFCEEEWDCIQGSHGRVETFFDLQLAREKAAGKSWLTLVDEIIRPLPAKVWISFDIDGLDPRFCPHTGTPVPGGLDYQEAVLLIGQLAKSGRKILGFDLNEVAPGKDEWDANVGARLLYKMSAWALASQGIRQKR